MSDLPDLFPGFASHWIDAPAGSIFARSGGSGPPLLLLHGFGETHVAFEKIAPRLAERFFVVAMDLRGYGWSSAPASEKGEAYTKRAQGEDVIVVMEQLGHVRFSLIGHDRGARVGFRLALDHPGRLEKLALLDIAPLEESLGDANLKRLGRARLLSQPAPKPEQLIGLDPKAFLADTLASGTKSGTLDAFDARAFAHYRAAFDEPSRIHAFCEDFRAGAGPDRELDLADRAAGEKIVVPTLALWGAASFSGHGSALLEQWREWADDLRGAEIDSGHYLAEEAPEATFAALDLFL
ncbi:fluoroacetate dehalogenase [Methylosinus sp. R-45379]|uniref:alpha/beta fold hydrolase n=1 Tax=Methylosinus sp. R-45379 TaxID=980563 RepID=UPI0007C8F0A2|nr:alpha/beta hydrolase [Methylosinus sp. R-45379]OAI25223.1 fluoroacetate dehalogenase [Methylosinus sp. R-45379]